MAINDNPLSGDSKSDSALTTGVDALIDLLKNSNEMTFSEAAKKLGVQESLVEGWARFLEESGDISINYKLTTAYMSLAGTSAENSVNGPSEKEEAAPKNETNFSQIHRFFKSIDNAYNQSEKLLKNKNYNLLKSALSSMSKGYRDAYTHLSTGKDKMSEQDRKIFEKRLSDFESNVNQGYALLKKKRAMKAKASFEKALKEFYDASSDLKEMVSRTIKEPPKEQAPKKAGPNFALKGQGLDYDKMIEYAKKQLEEGNIDEAKKIYSDLNSLYHEELPKKFETERDQVKKGLFNLSRDLTFAIDSEQRSRFEKAKSDIEAGFQSLNDAFKQKDVDAIEYYLKLIKSLYNNMPQGFENEKKYIQARIAKLSVKAAQEKKKQIDESIKARTKELSELRKQFYDHIQQKDYETAKASYTYLKQKFSFIPDELVPEKIDEHVKILDDFKALSELYKEKFLSQNRSRLDNAKEMIAEMRKKVNDNNISEAEKDYNNIQITLQDISDYFFEEKAALENDLADAYNDFLDKTSSSYKSQFDESSNEIKTLIREGQNYIAQSKTSLAEEAYVKALKIYSQLAPGFVQKKQQLRDELFDLYKKLMMHKDMRIIEEKSKTVHEAYNQLINTVIDAHHAIAMNNLDKLKGHVDSLNELAKMIPDDVWKSSPSLKDEVSKLDRESQFYLKVKALEAMLGDKTGNDNNTKLDNALQEVIQWLGELSRENTEDTNLLDYAQSIIDRVQGNNNVSKNTSNSDSESGQISTPIQESTNNMNHQALNKNTAQNDNTSENDLQQDIEEMQFMPKQNKAQSNPVQNNNSTQTPENAAVASDNANITPAAENNGNDYNGLDDKTNDVKKIQEQIDRIRKMMGNK